MDWIDNDTMLICDRDGGRILVLPLIYDGDWQAGEPETWLDGLDRPHDVALLADALIVSEAGRLRSFSLDDAGAPVGNGTMLVDGIPTGNHQTNAVNVLPNGTLVWHSGSTCNVCEEADERNAALLWVNASTGEHGVLASGVRNSFDGTWVDGLGYLFSDNGRDWEGDHPPEEVNLLLEGANYGWPDDAPETPVPEGSEAPVATWTPHSSLNGLAHRPMNSSLPGGNHTVYATVYGSWNSIVPVGHEIVRIDFTQDEDGSWSGATSVFASDLGTPLPIVFHPNGDLFYATFGGNGRVHVITAS
jgi:glucose/arabinose dehydrogenase